MSENKSFRLFSTTAILLLLIMTLISTGVHVLPLTSAQKPDSDLTGRIFDRGEDTDGDGLFNFLAVDVEVEVNMSGTYKVGLGQLRDEYYNYLYFYVENETYLDTGLQNVSVSLSGIAIHGSKRNFTYASYVSLYYGSEYSQFVTQKYEIPLSRTYSYALFDGGAALTGNVYSEGKDTDGDGLFERLELSVQINVTDEAEYELSVSELHNVSEHGQEPVSVWNSTKAHLSSGLQNFTVSFLGAQIYASHATNISEIDSITLEEMVDHQHYPVDSISLVRLDRAYSYLEFESLVHFTGTMFDEGVDSDGNSEYDYLEFRVEVNVTEAGDYMVTLQNLLNNYSDHISAYAVSTLTYYVVGVHLVNLTVYGPAIYSAHLDPVYVGRMDIYNSGTFSFAVDTVVDVPLTTTYKYTDFESHAAFTGTHSDMGVDTDGNGLYDYLAMGFDVNVTKAGTYGICTDSFTGIQSQGFNTVLYARLQAEAYFTSGVHKLYLNCSGPLFAQSHFSPTALPEVTLYEKVPSYFELDKLSYVSLSKTYTYSLFDAPQRETQVDLVVYPNGTVSLAGDFNFTHIYPAGMLPGANVTIDSITNHNTTTTTANGMIIIPPILAPSNSTTGHLSAEYANGLLNASADATIAMPPETRRTWPFNTSDFTLKTSYSNGLLNADLSGQTVIPQQFLSSYPFNITDIVVLADCKDNSVNGNITFHTVSGLPLADVITYISGNRTDLHLTGSLTVVYGNYFGTEVNHATVDDTIGNLTDMVQEITQDSLEVTQLNTTKTPLFLDSTEYGENVDYNITLHGNFSAAIAKLLLRSFIAGSMYPANETRGAIEAAAESFSSSVRNASLKLLYYRTSQTATFDLHATSDVKAALSKALELVPAAFPSDNRTIVEAWLKIANATASAYENLSLNASYSSATQELDLHGLVSANCSRAEEDVRTLFPDTVPPELRETFEAYMNTTYCKLKSANATLNSTPGTVSFAVHETFEGDCKAELNRDVRFIKDYLDAIMQYGNPYSYPSMWFTYPFTLLNGTEIDINNFKAQLNSGSDWVHLTFNGVLLQPPKDQIDSVRFTLSKLFNMTAGYNPTPTEFDKLEITVTGGTDANQTILLFAPSTVPNPASASLNDASMTWQNTAPSTLSGLRFLIAHRATISYAGVTEDVPIVTNSTISNFNFNPGVKTISFNVEGPAGTGFCNVTIPKSVLYASSGNWTVKIDGVTLPPSDFTVTENSEYAFIYFDYPHSQHSIEITGTTIVPEFQPNLLPPLLAAITLATLLITVRKRRKLSTLKTSVTKLVHNKIPSFIQRAPS